jgi:hypothetical protein
MTYLIFDTNVDCDMIVDFVINVDCETNVDNVD